MMSRKERNQGGVTISGPSGQRAGCLGRLVALVFILAVIALVTFWVAVRLEGGRSLIEDWLRKQLDTDVSIEKTRIGFPYDLVVTGVRSGDYESSTEAGFKAGQVRIGLGMRSLLRVRVSSYEVTLVQGKDGAWQPEALSDMGQIPLQNIGAISKATRGIRRRMELKSEDGLIRWMDGSSNELASARITRFDMVPVRVPRRRMYYYCLKAYKVLGADGVSVHDVEREWLASDVRPYVEISRSGRPVSEADTGFWECSE